MDFAYLKRLLKVTNGNLGRHLDVLAEQGLIIAEKTFEARRPRTWVEITPIGQAHAEQLRNIGDAKGPRGGR